MSSNVNFDELKALQKQLQAAEKQSAEFVEKLTKEVAARFLRSLKKITPVYQTPDYIRPLRDKKKRAQYQFVRTGGELRRAWKAESIQDQGGMVRIVIFNPLKYASYVNYGHRQTPGRFVPQIGLRLKKSWVDGLFFMEKAENEILEQLAQIIKPQLDSFLKGVFNAD